MKRSIDETDDPNANDARQKLKDSLIPFDQSREASEALLLQCCYSILERQPSRSLNVRGLVHELNRTVAPGAFTKRGEERTASTYVKQVLVARAELPQTGRAELREELTERIRSG